MRAIEDLAAFTDTRLQLHVAAQAAGAFGATYAEAHPLWHHTALRWDPAARALLSAVADGTDLRVGLRIADATLLVLECRTIVAQLELQGHTWADTLAWLDTELAKRGLDKPLALRPAEKMPPHPTATRGRFKPDEDAAHELADLYADAHTVFQQWIGRFEDPGPILVWPHHFDMAVLRVVVPGTRVDAEDARTIGYGMTPGDEGTPEPYGYVMPWPAPESPDVASLPSLPVGTWQRDGWFGARLLASEHDGSHKQLLEWLAAANEACEGIIGVGGQRGL